MGACFCRDLSGRARVALLAWGEVVGEASSAIHLRRCPHCHGRGEIKSFGFYSCSACRSVFITDDRGRVISSVGLLCLRPGAVIFLGLIALLVAHDVWRRELRWWSLWDVTVPLGLLVVEVFRRKKFPVD